MFTHIGSTVKSFHNSASEVGKIFFLIIQQDSNEAQSHFKMKETNAGNVHVYKQSHYPLYFTCKHWASLQRDQSINLPESAYFAY